MLLFMVLLVSHVHAVGTNYATLSPLPCIESPATANSPAVTCGGTGNLMTNVDITGYVQKMFNLFIAIAGVAAVFMGVMGGFEYMTTDAFRGKDDAKKKLKGAAGGLILVLCSFLILRTINPRLVDIPVGLVAPLGVHIDPNALTFINDMGYTYDSIINQLSTERLTLQTVRSNVQTQISDLQAQKTALQHGPSDSTTAARIAAIDDQIANLNNQLNTTTANILVKDDAMQQNSILKQLAADKTSWATAFKQAFWYYDYTSLNKTAVDSILSKSNADAQILQNANQPDAAVAVTNLGLSNASNLQLEVIRTLQLAMNDADKNMGGNYQDTQNQWNTDKVAIYDVLAKLPPGTQKDSLQASVSGIETRLSKTNHTGVDQSGGLGPI